MSANDPVALPLKRELRVKLDNKMTFAFLVHNRPRASLTISMCSGVDRSRGSVPLEVYFDFDKEEMHVRSLKDGKILHEQVSTTCCNGDIPIDKGTEVTLTIMKIEGFWEIKFPDVNIIKEYTYDSLDYSLIHHLYIDGGAVDVHPPQIA